TRLSLAPTRVKMRSASPISASAAGTKLPICASSVISATCRRYVDLPPMLGPVTTRTCSASGSSVASFGTKRAPATASTTGCRARQRRLAERDRVEQRLEQVRLEHAQPLLGAEHPRLVLLQGRRHEALHADQGLLALVVLRHEREVRARHLDVVAEDAVVAHLERGDPRPGTLRRLEAREPALPVARALAELVHLRGASGPDEARKPGVRRRGI